MIDDTDRRILAVLLADARTSMRSIAEEVGVRAEAARKNMIKEIDLREREIQQLKSALVEQERLFHRATEAEQERWKHVIEKTENTIVEQRKFIETLVHQKQNEVFIGSFMKFFTNRFHYFLVNMGCTRH